MLSTKVVRYTRTQSATLINEGAFIIYLKNRLKKSLK